jgi:hypothetical protein
MPSPGTPRTSLRLDLDQKAAAQARCNREATTLTEVINAALADYAAGHWSPGVDPLAPIRRLVDKWRDLDGIYMPIVELERALAGVELEAERAAPQRQHAHTYGTACPETGCRWPLDDTATGDRVAS